MIVPNQSNIKVHFAATENVNQFNALTGLGSNYSLYTVYPFLERVLFKKAKHPLIGCQYKNKPNEIPVHNTEQQAHNSGFRAVHFDVWKPRGET